jgi:hypothetical protein
VLLKVSAKDTHESAWILAGCWAVVKKSPHIQLIPGRHVVSFRGETIEFDNQNCYNIYAIIVRANGKSVTGDKLPNANPGRTLRTHLPDQLKETYVSEAKPGGGFYLKPEYRVP